MTGAGGTPVEAEFTDGVTWLYRLYDSNGALLYVGVTGHLRVRMGQHAADKPWWEEVTRKTFVWYGTRSEAEEAETAAINAEGPRYNASKGPQRGSAPAIRRTGVAGRRSSRPTGEVVVCLGEALAKFRQELEAAGGDPGRGEWPSLTDSLRAALHEVRDLRDKARTAARASDLPPSCRDCNGNGFMAVVFDVETEDPEWFKKEPCRPCLTTGLALSP